MSDYQSVRACRACGSDLAPVLSLGRTPLANSLLEPGDESLVPTYPLDLLRCPSCALVQLGQIVPPERLFGEYVYFSSFSETMLRHAEAMAESLIAAERLGAGSSVVEVASNDGYLLRFFQQRGVPVLGIEPARNVAAVAEERGIPTMVAFFGREVGERLASEGRQADVLIGNNILAHVPDLNDFVAGVGAALKPGGVAVFEFPYLRDMLDKVEFDTIYHEHQCYFSLTALEALLGRHELAVCDVERVSIHGGSLRLSAAHRGSREASARVEELRDQERGWVHDEGTYAAFADAVRELKGSLVEVLGTLKRDGGRIAAYGAAAKGVTLLSYCGIDGGTLDFVVDRSTHKQGKLFPVGRLPILPPEELRARRPDYTLLLTWNFADEILAQQAAYREAGGRFVVPVPAPRVV